MNAKRRPVIVLYEGELPDGRNRLDAMELVGIKFGFMRRSDVAAGDKYIAHSYLHSHDGHGINVITDDFRGDPYEFVLSANLHRRHLTPEQRRDLIAKVLKARPEASNRRIAAELKVDHKKVAAVRRAGEATGEISPVEKTIGKDGKARKRRAHKPASRVPPKHPPKPQTIDARDQVNSFTRRLQQFVNELGDWLAHCPPLDDEAKSALANVLHVGAEELDRVAKHISDIEGGNDQPAVQQ